MTETHAHVAAPADAAEGTDRKKLLLLGGVAALAVAAGGGYYLMSSGSSTVSSGPVVPLAHSATHAAAKGASRATTAKAAKRAAVKPTAVVPATSTVAVGRNPFGALYVAPSVSNVAASGSTPPVTTGTTGTSTPTTGTSGTTSGTTSGSSGTTPSTGTTTATNAPYVLQLVSVKQPGAGLAYEFTFRVAGTAKTVVMNQRFGKYGELVVLSTAVDHGKVVGAFVQVGDDSPIGFAIGDKKAVL